MNETELLERIERLESHQAHLEHQFDELNKVIIEQQKTIQKVQMHLQRMGKSLDSAELERIRATNPKPPHYQ
jgi:uncharacterized coiled-coil protein SlyX